MTTQSKKTRKIGVSKNAIVAKPENAKVEKTEAAEKPKKRLNAFGASGVRPNRAHNGLSVEGDRKWIFRAVMKTGAGGTINRADTAESLDAKATPVMYETTDDAQKAAEVARAKNPSIVNARVFPRQGKRVLWVAFSEDNGKLVTA